MLTKILQVLCRGSGLSVWDPYTLETGLVAIDQDVLETYDALVLRVHVNDPNLVYPALRLKLNRVKALLPDRDVVLA